LTPAQQLDAAVQRGDWHEADRLCRVVLGAAPDHADALNLHGVVLLELRRYAEALEQLERALQINPKHADFLSNRGLALSCLQRSGEALQSCDLAVGIDPGHWRAWYNRGNALLELKRADEALASYDRALAIHPRHADALINRGLAFAGLGNQEAAVQNYNRALEVDPGHVGALNNLGIAFNYLRRYEEALESYRRAMEIKPDTPFLLGSWLHAKMRVCDWRGLPDEIASLESRVSGGQKASPPFPFLTLSASAALQRQAAEIWASAKHPPAGAGLQAPPGGSGGKIRIGYFSADFMNHATSYLMAELLERHDRSRFEVFAFSFGPDAADEMRRRVAAAVDRFIDVRRMHDAEVARLSRSLGIDIAVDLKGYTQDSRPGIFALRAAPLQVNYLGYPGTMGAGFMDYVVADATLIPEADRVHYREKVVCLPDSYQPNDASRRIADRAFTRAEAGLPSSGFVFCSFNDNYKITPAVFDAWCRILRRVEGSVLWLLESNPGAAANLRREAAQRGVGGERLVFGRQLPLAEHLARHRLADLFLDTLPYNAHTTASDALWAGLPVLTRLGEAFAGRVAASLLRAAGLPELVTPNLERYEARAVELATDRTQLDAIKRKLDANRLSCPLFDSRRFALHIEAAYAEMHRRRRSGLPPEHFSVPPR
jgi:predicted O-linked N-acetylglucosamine transferase (SPINDLY family)